MRRLSLFISAFVLLVCSGCAKDLVTGKKVLNFYSLESEPNLGNEVLEAQLKAAKRKDKKTDKDVDPVEYERLQRVVERLKPVTHHPDFPYEIHLTDVDVVNAWCAPGGKMMVYTGLWDEKKGLVEKGDEDQLAAVIAHEMAHANARHVTEAMSQGMTILMAGTAAQSIIGAAGSSQGANIFGRVFSEGVGIYFPSYSRKNEYEADRMGLFYMAKAGYDPGEAVKLWKKAAKKKKDYASIYASHPSSGERAKKIEELLPQAEEMYAEAMAKAKAEAKTKKSKRKISSQSSR